MDLGTVEASNQTFFCPVGGNSFAKNWAIRIATPFWKQLLLTRFPDSVSPLLERRAG